MPCAQNLNPFQLVFHKEILYGVIRGVIRTIANSKVVTTGRAPLAVYLAQSFLFLER